MSCLIEHSIRRVVPAPSALTHSVQRLLTVGRVCVCSVWVPYVALPSGGGSSVGPSPLCGSPVWVPCAGPLCGSPVWVPSLWVPRRTAFHVASTRVMSPARSHAPAQHTHTYIFRTIYLTLSICILISISMYLSNYVYTSIDLSVYLCICARSKSVFFIDTHRLT